MQIRFFLKLFLNVIFVLIYKNKTFNHFTDIYLSKFDLQVPSIKCKLQIKFLNTY